MKDAVTSLSPELRAREAAAAARALVQLPLWHSAPRLLIYDALPDEVPTVSIISSARRAGMQLYLPRITGETLHFLPMPDERDPAEKLVRHPLGMREPAAGSRWRAAADRTIVVVPGRAFGRAGERLGRGGGFYDRFLGEITAEERSSITLVGLCYSVQLLDSLPVDSHDISMDVVITGREIIDRSL